MSGLKSDGFYQVQKITIPEYIRFAQQLLRTTAEVELNKQIALGNDTYVTIIDGRQASGRADIARAQTKVRFNFLAAALEIAIGIMRRELEGAIMKSTFLHTGKLVSSVKVYWGKRDGSFKEVTNINTITKFSVGDYIAVVPEVEYAGIVNHWVKLNDGIGFMGRAARRIRSQIGQPRARAGVGLSVTARFSMALANRLVKGSPKLKGKGGLPYIRIALKSTDFTAR